MNTVELLQPSQALDHEALAGPPHDALFEPPSAEESPAVRTSAGAILLLAFLWLVKFAALMLLVAVIVAPLFPGLVVLGLIGAVLAPPYLLVRRVRGEA